jgi:hypothetical protein
VGGVRQERLLRRTRAWVEDIPCTSLSTSFE